MADHEGTKLICSCGNGTFETYVVLNNEGLFDINSYCTECGKLPTDQLLKIMGKEEE